MERKQKRTACRAIMLDMTSGLRAYARRCITLFACAYGAFCLCLSLGILIPYAYADTRVVQQTDASVSIDAETSSDVVFNREAAQTFTVSTTTVMHSFAIGGCGSGILTNGGLTSGIDFTLPPFQFYGYDFTVFPIHTPIPGGWRHSGGSYTLYPGNTYYFSTGCGNGPGVMTGSAADTYHGGEAGLLEGVSSPIPTSNFFPSSLFNKPIRDFTFAVCSDDRSEEHTSELQSL